MKLAKLWYYCGLGLIVGGIGFIIGGIVKGEFAFIAKGIVQIILGFWWKRIGLRQMRGAETVESEQVKQLDAFVQENCIGCRFADIDALRNGEKWCLRPEPPECDKQYCYSREVDKEGGKCLTPG